MDTLDTNPLIFAAIGGSILGLATSLNYIIRGKVTGMSGIVFGIVSLNKAQLPQKLSIVGGMLLISAIFFLLFGYSEYSGFQPFGPPNNITSYTTTCGFIVSGFLVGFGTKLSNGCTSGHGLCGLPRLSLRSLSAVLVFLSTAIATNTVSHYYGLNPFVTDEPASLEITYDHKQNAYILIGIGLALPLIGFIISRTNRLQIKASTQIFDQIVVFVVGILFAEGLMISGMSRRQNIIRFLQLNSQWNPALMFVLGSGLLINIFTFTYMRRRDICLMGEKVFNPQNNTVDKQLLFGAFCFGLGWGIGGICPGPFLVLFAVATTEIQVLWGTSLAIGMLLANSLGSYLQRKKAPIKTD